MAVLGAGAKDARRRVPHGIGTLVASNWREGMGASLRAGLEEASTTEADAALIHLVDLPDVGSEVIARMLALGRADVLARATYGAVPGHPVLVGRNHWLGLASSAVGDRGGRSYLRRHGVRPVECGDLAHGRDVDTPGDEPADEQ